MSNAIELIYLRVGCLLQLTSKANCSEVPFSVFYETESIKSRSCKAICRSSPVCPLHTFTVPLQSFPKQKETCKTSVIPCFCSKFLSTCEYKISALSSSDLGLYCKPHICCSKQPFKREKDCTWEKGCERY